MATIPTYESQVTQVVPERRVYVPSTASAVVEGVNKGLRNAQQLGRAVEDYQRVQEQEARRKEKETYDLNEAPRYRATTDTLTGLNKDNDEIRKSMALAPNPDKANELLRQKVNQALDNPPEGLDPLSLQEWRKYVLAEERRLMLSNRNWGTKAAERAAKQAKQAANLQMFDTHNNDAWWAGITGEKYQNGTLSLDERGRYAANHIPALNADDANMQNIYHRSNLVGAAARPLSDSIIQGKDVGGILGDIDELEGIEADGFWSRNLGSGEKGKTKQEVGQEKIQEYYDGVRESVEASGLSKSEKNALNAYVDAQQRAKEQQFMQYIEESNLEAQSLLGRAENPLDVKAWVLNYQAQQDAELKAHQSRLELNPLRENATIDELRADDYLANLTFGNDYESVARRFSTLPMGLVDDFAEPLRIAVNTLSMPVGEWDKVELVQKYAPGGTLNENQVLETLLQNSPTLTLKGPEIDAMKAQNGFSEFDWGINAMCEIAGMPTNTNEEQQRKQAAVNHVLYQAQKEVNGGDGFQSPEFTAVFNDMLIGKQTNEDGSVTYNPLVANIGIANEMKKLSVVMENVSDNPLLHNESVSIASKGLLAANDEYRQTGDMNMYRNRMRKINQDMLASQYRGVLDIDDLQSKLDNKQQALFMYNGRPYEYLGFSGKDIFVKAGSQRQKLED